MLFFFTYIVENYKMHLSLIQDNIICKAVSISVYGVFIYLLHINHSFANGFLLQIVYLKTFQLGQDEH